MFMNPDSAWLQRIYKASFPSILKLETDYIGTFKPLRISYFK